MYLKDLRDACKQRKLKSGGRKADLIERLIEYDDTQAKEKGDAPVSQYPAVDNWTEAAMLAHLDMVLKDEDLQEYIFHEELQNYDEHCEDELD